MSGFSNVLPLLYGRAVKTKQKQNDTRSQGGSGAGEENIFIINSGRNIIHCCLNTGHYKCDKWAAGGSYCRINSFSESVRDVSGHINIIYAITRE